MLPSFRLPWSYIHVIEESSVRMRLDRPSPWGLVRNLNTKFKLDLGLRGRSPKPRHAQSGPGTLKNIQFHNELVRPH